MDSKHIQRTEHINIDIANKYPNFRETRSKTEITVTTQLSRALTYNNLLRIQDKPVKSKYSGLSQENSPFVYVYCGGTPPF